MPKTGFHDPIEDRPKQKSNKTPWDFSAPQYDDRTRVCAGTPHGVGLKVPVGREGNPKSSSPCLPMGKVKTLSVQKEGFELVMEE